jgi:hypothetical protein
MRLVVENLILEKIESGRRGRVLFIDDFENYGNPESVKKAMLRLCNKGVLYRLGHGIYCYPKIDKRIGIIPPNTDEIAQAIAKKNKVKLAVPGVVALNLLGLSTQVPMRVVYLTDGSSRTVKIGKRSIVFKRTSPKNLLAKGELSGMLIQALKVMGKDSIDEDIKKRIREILLNERRENILHDIKLAPFWIRQLFLEQINRESLG